MESFWACVVNPVAVTFPPSSDERAEKRGRERERGRKQGKWGGTKNKSERKREGRKIEPGKGCSTTMIWEMSTSSMRNARSIWLFLTTSTRVRDPRYRPFPSSTSSFTVRMLPSPTISSSFRSYPSLLPFEEIKEIPLWRSARSTTSLREMGCVCRNGISGGRRRSVEDSVI